MYLSVMYFYLIKYLFDIPGQSAPLPRKFSSVGNQPLGPALQRESLCYFSRFSFPRARRIVMQSRPYCNWLECTDVMLMWCRLYTFQELLDIFRYLTAWHTEGIERRINIFFLCWWTRTNFGNVIQSGSI